LSEKSKSRIFKLRQMQQEEASRFSYWGFNNVYAVRRCFFVVVALAAAAAAVVVVVVTKTRRMICERYLARPKEMRNVDHVSVGKFEKTTCKF
jgi:hypothetical protein